MFNRPLEYKDNENGAEARLDQLFRAYGEALPDPEPSVKFMPGIWARIEERERSQNWLPAFAKGLVTAAIAAYLLVAMASSPSRRTAAYHNAAYRNGNYVDALVADHFGSLEPLHLDRMANLEPGR
jgi:hypothetical protein